MNIIIYTRVSTAEQKESGLSLRNQYEQLVGYCQRNGHNIVKSYEEDCSGKNFERPQFKEMLQYIKSNKKGIDLILVTKWDRFGRTHVGSLNMLEKLMAWDVSVLAIEQPLDLKIPASTAILAFYLAIPEVENKMIGQRTKQALRRGNREGQWMSSAPYGYKNARNKLKQSILEPDEHAPFVIEAFHRVAEDVEPIGQIRDDLRKKGMKIVKQTFYNMLRNVVYIGQIKIKEWENEPFEIVQGIHIPLVSEELFYKVELVLSGRARNLHQPKAKNENLPLRGGLLRCTQCGGNLTGSGSRSRSGDKHYYYHCRKKCKERLRADKTHEIVTNYLSKIKIDEKLVGVFKEIMEETLNTKEISQENTLKRLEFEKKSLLKKIADAQDKVIDGVIDAEAFNQATTRYKTEIARVDNDIESISKIDSMQYYIDGAINILKNLDKFFENGGYEEKRALIGSTFPNKIEIAKNKCRTTSFNLVLDLFRNIDKGLGKVEKEKATLSDGLSLMAPLLGLEPRTL